MIFLLRGAVLLVLATASAQQPEPKHETIVVTGVYEPIAIDEVDRSVRVLPVKGEELLSNTLVDFLRLDPSLDVRQRAPNGLQADISIRGGTFGQTLILVDGQRMNDAQSGHHNMDIPLPLESISRIEVLRGSGSTLYGSDATGGVVNIITGPGSSIGLALVRHPGVDKISFTGSGDVGREIMREGAATLKRVSLELGGKSPNVFFADADFEAAVEGALFGVFVNQGEVCSAGSRVLIQRPIYKKMLDAMVEKAKRIRLGPGLDPATKMGPLVNQEQYDKVLSYIEVGRNEAKLAIGGGRPADLPGGAEKGFFVQPTIFYDVDNASRIARVEIFGPVMSVIPFDTEEDAYRIANDTPFGLAAAVWSRDHFKVMRAIRTIRAGIIWVNHMQPAMVEAPWGGYKQSGFGRELGTHGLDEFLEVKQVFMNLDEKPIGWYA